MKERMSDMTTREIVAKLNALQAKLVGDAEVSEERGLDITTINAYYRASGLVRNLSSRIEASATPQVTPAEAAAAYREVEEQGDDEAQMGRLLGNLRMMADDWGKSAVFLAGQPENRIEPCVKESATSRAAAYRHCSKLLADIIEQYGGQEAPE